MDLLSRNRPLPQRVLDYGFALSALSWALLGLSLGERAGGLDSVRVAIAGQHLITVWLFATRSRWRRAGSSAQILCALPSLLLAGLSFKLAGPTGAWGVAPRVAFLFGLSLASWALLRLGSSFAVLPSLRRVVVRGPYACLRHPAYLGELLMIAACLGAASQRPAWVWLPPQLHAPGLVGLGALGLIAVVSRIHAEETICNEDPGYRAYVQQVRWRLCPRIW